MRKINLVFLTALVIVAFSVTAHAATRYSVATGNWNATSTWSATSGGASGATVPVAGTIYLGGSFGGTQGVFNRGTGSTVIYNGGDQTISKTTFYHLVLSGSGTKTMQDILRGCQYGYYKCQHRI